MSKFICIHGHFYQPPRENPWLEQIEVQDSAYPYRDWNKRITAECYNPNTAARMLNGEQKVIGIVNNYSKISFNFGPTLLSWMEDCAPEVYSAILEADKESIKNFSGHGSALAQVYNHIIMPLANLKDKQTQVIWGIEDFKHRFGREPEGMWLAETAADTETLEVLSEQGIKFTILAPGQAAQVKAPESNKWINVEGGRIDPRRPYICKLPSGRSIALFFYDGPISQELGFGELLSSGENLANRLLNTLSENDEVQLAHIATDGETYGHHKRHGDMALAYCLHYLESNNLAKITNYGEFLEICPPEWEVKIIENSSWSCIHGIERWRSDCGCNSGREGWHQRWRQPLREALDMLRNTMLPEYTKEAARYTPDVWKLRDEYIKIILDRSPQNMSRVFKNLEINAEEEADKIRLLKLLEIQRHAMLMYTSCGWFFDEISGIETVQVMLYAARAIQLYKELTGKDLEPLFREILSRAEGNTEDTPTGAEVYLNYVKPSVVDLLRVASHYGVSSLFEEYNDPAEIFCYEVFNEKYERIEAGKHKMIIGRGRMRSKITSEEQRISYAFLHMGDHNVNGGVRQSLSEDEYAKMQSELKESFKKLNIAEIIHLFDKHFGMHSYTLWHLFKDESRSVFEKIMEANLNSIEFSFRQIYEAHYPIMFAMKEMQVPIPKPIIKAVESVINKDLLKIISSHNGIDFEKLKNLTSEIKKWDIELDLAALNYAGSEKVELMMERLKLNSSDTRLMSEIIEYVQILEELNIKPDLWRAQNILFTIHQNRELEKSREADTENSGTVVNEEGIMIGGGIPKSADIAAASVIAGTEAVSAGASLYQEEAVKKTEESDKKEEWMEYFRLLQNYLRVKIV